MNLFLFQQYNCEAQRPDNEARELHLLMPVKKSAAFPDPA